MKSFRLSVKMKPTNGAELNFMTDKFKMSHFFTSDLWL